ncbi:MAG: hypothetical protein K2W95_12055 [Candidatus Obscuribacterales bacterium]|nr:hypothetical protein [Candidatus Obscuribacterales bacterium]
MFGVDQIYLVSGCIGFVYIVGTAVLGQLGGDSDDGGADGPDSGADDGGIDGADGPDDSCEGSFVKAGHSAVHTAVGPYRRSDGLFYALIKILSPMRIALMLFMFGASGIILSRALPMLGGFSVIPAALIAFEVSNRMLRLLGRFVRKMERSDAHRKEDAIGAAGTLTVPITDGGVGEVTFVQSGMRINGPARAASSTSANLPKSSRVIISDFRDGVYLVEAAEESC